MAANLNRMEVIGRLGADPEIKKTKKGKKFAVFSVATSEAYKNEAGENVETTTWHNITAFVSVDYVEKWLKKGDSVRVVGPVAHDKYTDDKGVERYYTRIKANEIMGLAKASDTPKQQPAAAQAQPQARSSAPSPNQVKQSPQNQGTPSAKDEDFPWE